MKKSKLNSEKIRKILGLFVLISLIVAIISIIVFMCMAPNKQKSDYTLTLVQCILGVIVLLLPSAIEKKINIQIPSKMMVLFTLFIYAAIVLGEVRNFYYTVPHFDTILHTFSGGMLGTLGFSIIAFLNKSDKIPVTISPIFVACFTFCFALSLGTLWEIYEFVIDGILNTNMQKYMLEEGTILIGRGALMDTMKDLIVDMLGALVISIIGYISIKYEKGWIEKFQIKRKKL